MFASTVARHIHGSSICSPRPRHRPCRKCHDDARAAPQTNYHSRAMGLRRTPNAWPHRRSCAFTTAHRSRPQYDAPCVSVAGVKCAPNASRRGPRSLRRCISREDGRAAGTVRATIRHRLRRIVFDQCAKCPSHGAGLVRGRHAKALRTPACGSAASRTCACRAPRSPPICPRHTSLTSNTLAAPSMSPASNRWPSDDHRIWLMAAPESERIALAADSASRFRCHSSRRPVPSQVAKTAGCVGDHCASHT